MTDASPDRSQGLASFFALACVITWLAATPLALAWHRHEPPPPYAIALAGLSAFGPLLATLLVAGPRGELRAVFARWSAKPTWILAALLTPLAFHLVATAIFAALGGHPAAWLHPPKNATDVAALIVFPLGEELGWRGFAHPRMARRFGAVRGALLLGVVWGVWHLAYAVTPTGVFDGQMFAVTMAELPLYAVVIAWAFERTGRSLLVAIAFHAGAHLDHVEAAGGMTVGMHLAHLGVVGVGAVVAGWGMRTCAGGE